MIKADHVWMNGKLIPYEDAKTHVGAFTLHYGVAAFEGVRCYKRSDGTSAIFRLREHIDRLFESSKICVMDIPFSREQLEIACAETLRANQHAEAYLRPLVYVGAGALGLGATGNPIEVAILTFPWSPLLGDEGVKNGVRAHVSSFIRGHVNATMSKGKISGQYVNSIMAKRESQRLGFEEAIMLDANGFVAEGTGENIFIEYAGRVLTPPLYLPVLAGITRASIMTLAREAGIELIEQPFTRDMLYTATEVFFTGTGAEVVPVREIDGRVVGSGKPGPITKKLQAAYYAAVRGPGDAHPEWLYRI